MTRTPAGGGQAGLLAASCTASLLFGVIVGYIAGSRGGLRASSVAAAYAAPAAAPAAQPPPPGLANNAELQAYRDILARDPKNVTAATALGNMLYDAGRYAEAIPYYQQAFALDPKNANLSTDLGTALWYTGRADDALAQYRKSLAAAPNHAQTLFNIGIIRLEGKQDPWGAVEAWTTLLSTNSAYPEADKVRRLIAEAQQKIVGVVPSRVR